jgi:surface antigen
VVNSDIFACAELGDLEHIVRWQPVQSLGPEPEGSMIAESKRLALGACVAAALLAIIGTASAQWRHFFPEGFTMTREDLDRQREAARSLLEKEPPPVGARASWANPRSGTRGTVTMINARDAGGRSPCRRMRYEVSTRGAAAPVDFTFTACRMPDGTWKAAD